MKFHAKSGLWFPDTETRPDKMYGGLMKYRDDPKFFLSLLPPKVRKRACIQAGGHVGVWPLHLSQYFAEVYTFEPDPPVYEALRKNCETTANIVCYPAALGDTCRTGVLSYYSTRTAVSTMAEIKDQGDLHATVDIVTIDSLKLDVAAIVLDIEGFEPWALKGARDTIARCRPLIMCEMLARSTDAINETLAGMGYFPVDNPINRKCRDRVFAYRGLP